MLKRQHRGFSLIELMVTVVIAGVLLALAAPSFSAWIQNTRIRNTATAIYTGVERARSEAIQRNIQARFQLTTDLTSGCALSSSGTAWVISQVDASTPTQDATGKCNLAIDTATTPRLLATRAPDSNSKVVVSADASSVVFNSLGKVTSPATDVTIQVSASTDACQSGNGNLTCLNIIITPAGQTRMCNPRFPSTDPQGC